MLGNEDKGKGEIVRTEDQLVDADLLHGVGRSSFGIRLISRIKREN